MMFVPFIVSFGVLYPILGLLDDSPSRVALQTFATVPAGHVTAPAHTTTQILGSFPAGRSGKFPFRAVAELRYFTTTFIFILSVRLGVAL